MFAGAKMIRLYLTIPFLLSSLFNHAQLSNEESAWVKKNIAPIESLIQTDKNSDLSFLKKTLKDTRIVLIGESSHGTKEFYQVKTRLVKYLHDNLGFDVLIMESGMGETFTAYGDVRTSTDTALMRRTQFQNFQCTELLELFTYIKQNSFTENELKFVGLDVQHSSYYFLSFMERLFKGLDTGFAKKAMATFNQANALPQIFQDSIAFIRKQDEYLAGMGEIKLFINTNAETIQRKYTSHPNIMAYLNRIIDNLVKFNRAPRGDFDGKGGTPMKRVFLRDEIMADNIFWYTDLMFPGKKIIFWAHNAHISRSNTAKGGNMSGEYVAKKFGSKAFSLGIFSLQGETYQFWDKSKVQFNNKSDSSLERRLSLHFNSPAGFLDIRGLNQNKDTNWLFKENKVYELELGREHNIIPASRHDGILIIKNSSIPTYIWK